MPAPPIVRVTEADAEGIKLTAHCWVKNGDWLTVRSDLWMNVVDTFNKDDRVTMSRPQQEIYVIDEKGA